MVATFTCSSRHGLENVLLEFSDDESTYQKRQIPILSSNTMEKSRSDICQQHSRAFEKHPDGLILKSCLVQEHYSGSKPGKQKKAVRFPLSSSRKNQQAQSQHEDDVCCLIRTFEKEDQKLLDSLFWTHEELHQTFDEEQSDLLTIEPIYGDALRSAYEQCSTALTSDVSIDLDWQDKVPHSSRARGLELDMFPSIKNYTRKHRRAVLIAQEALRKDMDDESCWNFLRKVSRKYSRPSRLVAAKLAELDTMSDLPPFSSEYTANSMQEDSSSDYSEMDDVDSQNDQTIFSRKENFFF